jgi:hypothetical protein
MSMFDYIGKVTEEYSTKIAEQLDLIMVEKLQDAKDIAIRNREFELAFLITEAIDNKGSKEGLQKVRDKMRENGYEIILQHPPTHFPHYPLAKECKLIIRKTLMEV